VTGITIKSPVGSDISQNLIDVIMSSH